MHSFIAWFDKQHDGNEGAPITCYLDVFVNSLKPYLYETVPGVIFHGNLQEILLGHGVIDIQE